MSKQKKKGKQPRRAKRKRRSRKKPAEKKGDCFVISPFGGWHDRYYEDIYEVAVVKAKLEAKRADDLYRPSTIINDIWSYIRSSRVMLADLTGKNPNVFYELGLAHAAGKPVVLLTQNMDDVPFDLRALRVIDYDVEDPQWSVTLQEKIQKALEEVMASPRQAVLPTFVDGRTERQRSGATRAESPSDLQQQLDMLRTELRSMRRDKREEIGPTQARMLLERYLKLGMPKGLIFDRLVSRGAPAGWVEHTMAKLKRRPKRRKSRAVSK